MSNMKRLWEEEQERLRKDEQERNYREAGLTKETVERMSKWIENTAKESKDDKSK